MRDHYDDLKIMERHLVEGDLPTVRDYAFALAVERSDSELARWEDHLTRLRSAAEALGMAQGVAEAARRMPLLAAACARCHREAGAAIHGVDDAPAPVDGADAMSRMERHQWAADRLWLAMITSSDAAWGDGLSVLAETPLPTTELATVATPSAKPKIEKLSDQLQNLAKRARGAGSWDKRATEYGEILVVCAACHELAR